MKRLIILWISLWCFCAQATAATITDVRASGDQQKTRLVLNLSDRFKYNIFTLAFPSRLVIDVAHSELNPIKRELAFHKTLFNAMRSAKRADHKMRLVFDLKYPVSFKTFVIKPSRDNQHYRLVVDLKRTAAAAPSVSVIRKVIKPVISIPKKKNLRDVVVIIDPGHGGKDPGAVGARGTREKNVVLAIGQQLQRDLNREPHIKAYLTRRGDYYIGLRKRLSIARDRNADVFISIHADAFHKRHSNGASVFALSPRGASSEAARWLAERENHSELGNANLNDKSYILRSVLIDLSQTATIADSLQLGSEVLSRLGRFTRLHNRKVEQAGFVVLKSPDIPSILIETGFISNHREERLLRSPSYRRKLANGIKAGVKNYFWDHAPPGTWIAEQRKAQQYTVRRGDSLGKIAQRFHVSTQALKQFNQLRRDALNIGQVISIPKRSDA